MAHRQPALASLAKPLLAGMLLSGLFLVARPASAGDRLFVCNKTDQNLRYATHSGRNNRSTKGWYKVGAGKCHEAIGITWSYPSSGINPYPKTTFGYFHAESRATNMHWPPKNLRSGDTKYYCVRTRKKHKSFEIQYDSMGRHRDIERSSNRPWSASCKGLGKSYRAKQFVAAPITKKWVDRQWPIPNEIHRRNCSISLYPGGKIDTSCDDWKKFTE